MSKDEETVRKEVDRVPSSPPSSPGTEQERPPLARAADAFVIFIARHWLAMINLAVAIYVFVPFLAPAFMHAAWVRPAQAVYGLYSFACHQLPDHSYFLFGDEPLYSLRALEANSMPAGLNVLQRRYFIGDERLGYKVALCQRDVAIYGSVLVAGLIFGLTRRRVRSPSLKIYALFLIPIALDGFTQLLGLRTSNWWLRTITGAIFGGASVWLAYPYLDEAMRDLLHTEQARRR